MISNLKEQLKIAGKDENEVYVALSYLTGKGIAEVKLLKELDKRTEKKLEKIIGKRIKKNMPLDKIFKSKNFYGREFYVNKHVLTPRPETELLVESAIHYCEEIRRRNPDGTEPISILDLCCGSGCIGLTLLNEAEKLGVRADIVLSDISSKALKAARKNAEKFGVFGSRTKVNNIGINRGYLFEGLDKFKFEVIVCNPPYINETDFNELDEEVRNFDPKLALVARNNGYYFYEKIAEQAKEYLNEKGAIFFEVGKYQSGLVCKLLQDEGFEVSIRQDYNNIDRVVIGKLH